MGCMPALAKIAVAVVLAAGVPAAAYFAGRWVGPPPVPEQPEHVAVSPQPSGQATPTTGDTASSGPSAVAWETADGAVPGPDGAQDPRPSQPAATGAPQETASAPADPRQPGEQTPAQRATQGTTSSSSPTPEPTTSPTATATPTETTSPSQSPSETSQPRPESGATPASGDSN